MSGIGRKLGVEAILFHATKPWGYKWRESPYHLSEQVLNLRL